MSIDTNDLISMIESLPIDVKTTIIEKILSSLQPIQEDIDKLWVKEVEDRISDIKSGKVQMISGKEVFKEIEERFVR
ncbi:addiction module protein [Syntrophomonas wolfei]|uniref:addiction module protein n=1 Tax=Syntrophomonas wolfei TaxID=863 RepID=UPI000A6288C3|nr:addiction module protein [Syntrophomonas wolfei]